MKNALIVLTALAGLFTPTTAGLCELNSDWCGKTLNGFTCYELVLKQLISDKEMKQSAEDIANSLFTCQDGGTIEFSQTCQYGCNDTVPGGNDFCNEAPPCNCCGLCEQAKCTCVPVVDPASTRNLDL